MFKVVSKLEKQSFPGLIEQYKQLVDERKKRAKSAEQKQINHQI